MASKRKISPLNLELETPPKLVRSLTQSYKMTCHCSHGEHDFHSNQPILNTIIDLIISLGTQIEEYDNQVINNITRLLQSIEGLVTHIQELEENLQYVKSQNNDVLHKLSSSTKKKEKVHLQDLNPLHKELVGECQEIKTILKEIKQIIIS